MRFGVDQFTEQTSGTNALGEVVEREQLVETVTVRRLVVHGRDTEFDTDLLAVLERLGSDHGDAEVLAGVGREVEDQEIASKLTRRGADGALPTFRLVKPNHHIERNVVLVADTEVEILLLSGRKPGLFIPLDDFDAVLHHVLTDDDFDREVKVTGIVNINTFLDDAGVNRVFTRFHLALNRDVQSKVCVLIRCQLDDHDVVVGTVGDGVVPRTVLGVGFCVSLNVTGVDHTPCGLTRAFAGVRHPEVVEHRSIRPYWADLTQRVVFTHAVAVRDDFDEDAKGPVHRERNVRSQIAVLLAGNSDGKQADVSALSVHRRVDLHSNGQDLCRADVRRNGVDAFLRQFHPGVVVVEPVLPVVWLLEHTDLERVRDETGVEHIEVEITDFFCVNIVRERLIVSVRAGGIGDLHLVGFVLVRKEPRRGIHVHLLEAEVNLLDGHLFHLPEVVFCVHSGDDFKRIGSEGHVAFRDVDLQLWPEGLSPAGEGVRFARDAPNRVRPVAWKAGVKVEDDFKAAGGSTGVLDEEFHRHRSAGCKEHDVGLAGREREVNVVFKEGDARVVKPNRMALDIFHQQVEWVIARGDTGRVGERVVSNQPVVVQAQVVVGKFVLKDHIGAVGRVHDEHDLLDVVPAKGITDFDGELHLTELGAMVG